MPEFTSYPAGTPSWVDHAAKDLAGSNSFYSGLFGWEADDQGEDMGHYTLMRKAGKSVAGNMGTMEGQPSAWTSYISVEDADATVNRAKKAGATVFVEPMDVADIGRMAVFADPTGAAIGVWQPKTFMGAELANEAGTFAWNELNTRDIPAAKAFYKEVFGWTPNDLDMEGMQYTEWKLGEKSIAGIDDHARHGSRRGSRSLARVLRDGGHRCHSRQGKRTRCHDPGPADGHSSWSILRAHGPRRRCFCGDQDDAHVLLTERSRIGRYPTVIRYPSQPRAALHTGEGEMCDATGRADRLNLEALIEILEPIPKTLPSSEDDRCHRDVQVVDQIGDKEFADGRGSSADADVEIACSLPCNLQRLGRCRVDEVEGRPALHRYRRSGVVCENEHRCVKWRIITPPPSPCVVSPRAALMTEFVAAHDFDPDARTPLVRKGVVHSGAAPVLAMHFTEAARRYEPLVKLVTCVSEWCFEALAVTRAEAVE